MAINYPTVREADIDGFARVWDCRGLKLIMDSTSKRFAIDFANVVLRSYIDDLRAKAAAALKAKQQTAPATAEAVPAAPAPEPEKSKSSIILTD